MCMEGKFEVQRRSGGERERERDPGFLFSLKVTHWLNGCFLGTDSTSIWPCRVRPLLHTSLSAGCHGYLPLTETYSNNCCQDLLLRRLKPVGLFRLSLFDSCCENWSWATCMLPCMLYLYLLVIKPHEHLSSEWDTMFLKSRQPTTVKSYKRVSFLDY